MRKILLSLLVTSVFHCFSFESSAQKSNCPQKGFEGCWNTIYQRCADAPGRPTAQMRIRKAEAGYLQGSWGTTVTMSRYSLYGRLTGNTWEGHWWEVSVPASESSEASIVNTGTFKFILNSSTNSFSGIWNTLRGICDPAAPSSRNLTWDGTKTPCICAD